jgi:hypothetical protein
MFEIDALFAGLLGGFIGGISIVCVMYWAYEARIKEYIFAKEAFKTRNIVLRLSQDVDALKMQVAALQTDACYAVTEADYR